MISPLKASAVEPSETDKQTARQLVFEGDQAFRGGNFADALARYSTAYRLVRVPSVGIEVARAQQALGQLRNAYRSALASSELPRATAERDVMVQARADAAALAKDLRERIPTLRLEVSPALVAARIDIDGVALSDGAKGGLWLDPGKHRVTISAAGFVTAVLDLDLVEREKRVLPVKLQHEKTAAVAGLEHARGLLARGQLRGAFRSALAVTELPRRGAEDQASADARADAAALTRDLRERIPTLRLDVEPAVASASIAIDGVVLEDPAQGRDLWLDPGKHRVTINAPGFASAEIALDLVEREKRVLPVKLAPTL